MPDVFIQVYGPFPDEDAVYDLARCVMADGLRSPKGDGAFADVGAFRDEVVRCHVERRFPTLVGSSDDDPAVLTTSFLKVSTMGFQRIDPPTPTDPSRYLFRPQGGTTTVSGVADWKARAPVVPVLDADAGPDARSVVDYLTRGRSLPAVLSPTLFETLRDRRTASLSSTSPSV